MAEAVNVPPRACCVACGAQPQLLYWLLSPAWPVPAVTQLCASCYAKARSARPRVGHA